MGEKATRTPERGKRPWIQREFLPPGRVQYGRAGFDQPMVVGVVRKDSIASSSRSRRDTLGGVAFEIIS